MRALILFLVVLALSQNLLVCVQGSACGSGTLEGSYCNCFAGSAPNYALGAGNCWHRQESCLSATIDDDLVSGNYAPTLLDANNPVTFSKDNIIITFVQPARWAAPAWARKEAYIKLYYGTTTEGSSTGVASCAYPGPMWTKLTFNTTCNDQYTFTMPWSSHYKCGFKKAATSATLTYTTTLEFSYNVAEGAIVRSVSNLFNINIQVARQQLITASLSLQLDSTSTATVTAMVVGSSAYDLLAGQTKLLFQTQTSWPYKISTPFTTPSSAGPNATSVPTNTNAVATPDLLFPDNCPTTANSICTQQFQVIVSASPGTCDLYGDYEFSTALVCSDVSSCTPAAGPTVVISVDHTNICAPSMVDPGRLITQSLLSFDDESLTTPRSDFETGDQIWWTFAIVDPSVSIDSVSLNTVTLSLTMDPSVYDTVYTAGGSPSTGALTNLTEAYGVVYPPGTTVVVSFKLALSRMLLQNTLGTLEPSSQLTTMNIAVSVDVEYHGNKRRTLSAVGVSPANNGQASGISSFVVRAKSEPETSLSALKKAAEQAQSSVCTGPSIACTVRSFASRVMSTLGL